MKQEVNCGPFSISLNMRIEATVAIIQSMIKQQWRVGPTAATYSSSGCSHSPPVLFDESNIPTSVFTTSSGSPHKPYSIGVAHSRSPA